MNDLSPLKQNDKESWLQHIWYAIEQGRENVCIEYDSREKEEDDINTAMAWIREELGLQSEVDLEKESEPMKHAVDAEGNQIVVGDVVEFKSDYEQTGEVTAILPDNKIELSNENGFGGEYLRYATKTVECASRCWVTT